MEASLLWLLTCVHLSDLLALGLSSYINAKASDLCILQGPLVFPLLKLSTIYFQFGGEGSGYLIFK